MAKQYAVMPIADYTAACDKLRSALGTTGVIKSGELADKIQSVKDAQTPIRLGFEWDESTLTLNITEGVS